MKLAIMLGTAAGNAALRIPHQSPVERRGGVPYTILFTNSTKNVKITVS